MVVANYTMAHIWYPESGLGDGCFPNLILIHVPMLLRLRLEYQLSYDHNHMCAGERHRAEAAWSA